MDKHEEYLLQRKRKRIKARIAHNENVLKFWAVSDSQRQARQLRIAESKKELKALDQKRK